MEPPSASVVTPKNKITKIVVLASIIASLGGILFGYDIGIISSANLQLRRKFDLSCLVQEIVVSCVLLGAFLGSLVAGSMVDYFGRRRSILGTSILFILGSVLLALSQNLTMLLIGRLLVGFGVALSTAAECTYISEISPPRWRGMLVSLNELGITVGFLLAYLVGHFFIHNSEGWRYMFGLAVVPGLIQLFGVFCLPPSPYFLVLQGKHIQAQEIIKKIHPGLDHQVVVTEITAAVVEAKCLGIRDLFSKKDNMRGRMFIGILLSFLQQMTGNTNVLYYAPIIFQQLGYCSDSAATLATVGLGGVKVLTAVIALMLVDKVGRRPLLICGSVLMALSVAVLGTVTVISGVAPPTNRCSGVNDDASSRISQTSKENFTNGIVYNILDFQLANVSVEDPSRVYKVNEVTNCTGSGSAWIRGASLTSLMVFIGAYQFSFGIGTWLVLSEIFPTKVRGRCIGISTSVFWAASVIFAATFLNTIEAMGIGCTMIMYACICSLSAFFIYLFIPETKQKTLEEITAELNKGVGGRCGCQPSGGAAAERPVARKMATPVVDGRYRSFPD